MPDPRTKLYQALSSQFDLGTQEEFNTKMDNPESRKKLYSAVSNDFDLGSFDEFEGKVASVKKKVSSSTSKETGSVSGTKTGSSAGINPAFKSTIPSPIPDFNKMKTDVGPTSREAILKKKLSSTKVTTANMDEISAATDELSALQKAKHQKQYQNDEEAIKRLNTTDPNRTETDLADEKNDNQVTDYIREGAKNVGNVIGGVINIVPKTINALSGNNLAIPTIDKFEKKVPLEKQLKQVRKEDPKNKLTPQEQQQRAEELFREDSKKEQVKENFNNALTPGAFGVFGDDFEKNKTLQVRLKAHEINKITNLNKDQKANSAQIQLYGGQGLALKKDIESDLALVKSGKADASFMESLSAKQEKYKEVEGKYLSLLDEQTKIKNTQLGVQENIDLFKLDYDPIAKAMDDTVGAFETPIGGVLNLMGKTADALRDISGAKSLDANDGEKSALSVLGEKLIVDAENRSKSHRSIELDNIHSSSDFGSYVTQVFTTATPYLLGGAEYQAGKSILGSVAGTGFFMAGSGGKKAYDMDQEMKNDPFIDYNNLQYLSAIAGYMGAEKLMLGGYDKIMKGAGATIKSIGKNPVERELFDNGIKTYFTKAVEQSGKFISATNKSGMIGLTTGVTRMATDNIALGKKSENPFKEMVDGYVNMAAMHLVMSGPPELIKTGAYALSKVSEGKAKKQVAENYAKISKLNEQLKNPDLTDNDKAILNSAVSQLHQDNHKTIGKSLEKLGTFTRSQVNELLKVDQEKLEVRKQVEGLKSVDSGVSAESKPELLKVLKAKFDAIEDRKMDVFNNEHNSLSLLSAAEQKKLMADAKEELYNTSKTDEKGNEVEITEKDIKDKATAIHLEQERFNGMDIKEIDALKRTALRELNAELTDEQKQKGISISNYKITKRAIENHNKKIVNETQTTPTPEAQPQAEVQKPSEAEKVETPKPQEVSPVEDVVAPSVENEIIKKTTNDLDGKISKDDQISFATSALPIEGKIHFSEITKTGNPLSHYLNKPENLPEKAKKIYDDLKNGGKLNNEIILLNENNKLMDATHRTLARLALGQTEFDYAVAKKDFWTKSYLETISEAYHKAKLDGSNPKLVKSVEELLKNEATPPTNPPADGNVRPGDKPNTAQGEVDAIPQTVKPKTNPGEVGKKLVEINKSVFGLDEQKSKANAVVMEKTIETMAERVGISKEEMFDKIDFEKGDASTAEKLSKKGNALFQIVGKNAKLSKDVKQFLNDAKALEKQGATAKEIFMQTGWEKGADGKWKYDMQEGKVEFKKTENGNLEDVLDYPELFEKYPEARKIKIVFDNNMDYTGLFNSGKNRIHINNSNGTAESRMTILHEIQHWIQKKEGFSSGGNEITARRFIEEQIKNATDNTTRKVIASFKDLISKKKTNSAKINEELSKLKKLLSKDDFDLYESIAGEVEARNVEERFNMPLEQRKSTPLSETENVSRDEQLVLFQGEQGAMLAEDGKYVIYALTNPNVSTPLHEMAHVYEHYLTEAERTSILKNAGHDAWEKATSEHFARGFEKYLADGIAPSPEMKTIFDNFKKWMTEIYNGITSSEIAIQLSPEMKAVFDIMLGAKETAVKPIEGKAESITTKKVKSVKDGEYEVDFDPKGNVVEIRSPKDGRKIEKFVERKVKPTKQNPTGKILVKNANYAKIEADAKGELSQNEKNNIEKEAQKVVDEKIRSFEPNDEYEIALKYVAEGGKVKLSSARSETGEKNAKVMKWASGFNKEADLPSIENVAEKLTPYDSHLDESSIRQHLIDIYSTFENQNEVKNHLLEIYDEKNAKKKEEELYHQLSQLSEKERAMYDAIQAEDSYFEGLTDKELDEYHNQKINEYEQGQREYARQETANEKPEIPVEGNKGKKGSENQNGGQIDGKGIIENSPEYKEVNAKLEKANEKLRIAKEALDRKAKSLDKELLKDNEDIFGERKSQDENKLFDERVDGNARNKATEKERTAIKEAQDEIKSLLDIKTKIQNGEIISTKEMDLRAEKGIDLKSTPDQILEWLDKQEKNLDDFGRDHLSVGIPIVAAKTAIQAMRVAVKAGKLAAEVIQAGIDAVKQTDWFKNLTKTEQDAVENDFHTNFLNKISAIDPANERQAENLLHRATSEHISEDDAYHEVKATFEKSRTELTNKKLPAEYVRDAYRNFVKKFSDRQYLAKSLLNKSGMKAVKNLIINSHGTSGRARVHFEEAYNKIYKKLTTEERKTLDEVIQAKRFIAIDSNREMRGLEPVSHPNFIDKNKSEKFLSKLEKEIGTEKYNDLVKRADAYFDTYKGLLKDMLDNGLISKESYDSMSDVDYQPRVFLQYITDFNGDMETNKRTNNLDSGGLSADQIKAMSEGDANSLVLNSEWLLSNSLLSRSKAMAMNNINKRFMTGEFQKAKARFEALDPKNLQGDDVRFYKYFKELNSKVIDNPIIGQTESGNNKYLYDKAPLNFAKMYYYIDGQQHQFFLEKELHESWNDNISGFLSSDAKEFISYASGSALVKAIATGNNPAFPIVNTPRDFMFNVAFSDQYSKLVPKAMFQVAKDAASSLKEIAKPESDVLKKYIEYGGAMDFLSSQGRLKKESVVGRILEKNISANTRDRSKKIFDTVTLHKISAYSEMMFRLGLFQRTIKNQLKELGLKDISEVTDKQQRDDIYNQAVANARSMMDFNQGGTITKDLESAIPYINAATQGGRVAISSFEKDPVGTTSRVMQIATIASTIPIGASLALISAMKSDDDKDKSASEIYLHAMSGISKYQKSKYMNIVTGLKNEEGEYQVLKIAKSQELTPVVSVTDDIYANLLRKTAGQEKKSAGSITQDALFSLNSAMPIDVTSPGGFFTRTPAVKATLTYLTGFDFFREEPLSMDIGKVPLAVEGINQSSTEDFYKKLGTNFGLSPVRSKAFVESLITGPSTNPFVGMLYGGADAATSDKDMKKIGGDLFESIYKSTGKRVVSYSTDFNRKLTGQQELQKEIDAINVDKYLKKAKFKELGNQFLNKEITTKEFNAELNKLEPYEKQMALSRIKDLRQLKSVSGTVLDIKYEREAKAKALMILHYYGDIFDGSKENKEVKKEMMRAKGILTPKVMVEYNKLKKELNKKAPH